MADFPALGPLGLQLRYPSPRSFGIGYLSARLLGRGLRDVHGFAQTLGQDATGFRGIGCCGSEHGETVPGNSQHQKQTDCRTH